MTGIEWPPSEAKTVCRIYREAGVGERSLDLLIREDLAETPPVTPETPGATLTAEWIEK